MRKRMAILVLLLLAGSAFAQGVQWFDGSFEAAKAKAKVEQKLILINFFSGSG